MTDFQQFCVPGLLTRGRGGFTRVPVSGDVTSEAGFQSALFKSLPITSVWLVCLVCGKRGSLVSFRVPSLHVTFSSCLFLNHHAPLVLGEDLHLHHVVQLPEFIKILCSHIRSSLAAYGSCLNGILTFQSYINVFSVHIWRTSLPPLLVLHLRCLSLSEALQMSFFLFSKGSTFRSIFRTKMLCK